MDRTDETTTPTGLRAIERLDQAKIDRIVEALSPMLKSSDDMKWKMGDALAEEWPLVDVPERGRLGMKSMTTGVSHAPVRLYLESVARVLDISWRRLEHYRLTAIAWPPSERHVDVSWSKHHLVNRHPDRHELVLLPWAQVAQRLDRATQRLPRSVRRQQQSFANISKAAEAAIEVLADQDIPAEKRVAIALNILVKFFEEAAAA